MEYMNIANQFLYRNHSDVILDQSGSFNSFSHKNKLKNFMKYNIFCRFSSKDYIFINKYFRHENCRSFDLLMYVCSCTCNSIFFLI